MLKRNNTRASTCTKNAQRYNLSSGLPVYDKIFEYFFQVPVGVFLRFFARFLRKSVNFAVSAAIFLRVCPKRSSCPQQYCAISTVCHGASLRSHCRTSQPTRRSFRPEDRCPYPHHCRALKDRSLVIAAHTHRELAHRRVGNLHVLYSRGKLRAPPKNVP